MRRRERDSAIALERRGHHFAAGSLDDQRMELLIHVAVAGFVRQNHVAFGEDLISLAETLVQRVNEAAGRPLFRQHASRQPFERAADVNRIHNFLRCECPHNETASIQLSQHAFLRQDG